MAAQAIDEYLFYLGKNKFFPPNYPLDRILTPERYNELDRQWRAAERQIQVGTPRSLPA